MAEQFKWVDFYMELASKLLEFKQRRDVLIKKVKNVYSSIGIKLPKLEADDNLLDIDPFTIFGLFNKRITSAHRILILGGFAAEFGVEAEVPNDFSGIPILNNMMSTFYAFTDNDQRKSDDIDNLWEVLESALLLAGTDSSDNRSRFRTAFDQVRSQFAVRWNLTMALFWVRPYAFVNLDSRNRKFMSNPDNISAEVAVEVKKMKTIPSADQYLSLLDKCKAAIDSGEYGYLSFPELSHKAYLEDTAKVWLISYNKDKWFWEDYAEKCEGTKAGETFTESWACTNKSPRVGDDVFLIKLGEQPRGLIGHGTVVSESYEKEHYDSGKAVKGKKENAIDVSFDCLLNYEKEDIVSQEELKAKCPEQHWSPQNSGIEIKGEVLDTLYSLWRSATDSEWWPKIEDFDPGVTADDYYKIFINEKIVKPTWLEALYEMYCMPNHLGTCKQMGSRYGYAPSHYISYLSTAAAHIANALDIPSLEEKGAQYWPVIFQGKHIYNKSLGSYCWKMRDPVVEAIEMLVNEGKFEKKNKLEEKELESMVQFDHNIILYGPPGTGKTYNSVIYAVAMCEGKSLEELRKEPYSDVLLRYRGLQAAGRVSFTTFHQSYGYEEFIEGIKPKLNEESETLSYSIEDGVFKEFCRRAKPINIQTSGRVKVKDHPRIWVMLLGGPGRTQLKEECFNKNEVRIGWNNFENVEWEDDENLSWRSKQMLYAFTYEMEPGDIVFIEKDSHSVDAIGVIAGDYEYDKSLGEYPRRRAVDWIVTNIDEDTMVLSGLNLFATVVGFAIMNDKLNKVSGKIEEVINLQKDTFDIQTVYKINEVIADYSNMMDGRKTLTYYTEKEMMKLVGDEWNALEMLIKVFCKGVSNNSQEFLFSMLSLASMLSTSLRFYDEIYYFEHKDVIRGGSIWHNDHDKWMSSFEKMLSKEFIERMQDYGFFDLDLNTSENDYFYKGYIEQISSLKQDVEDNQLLITSINDPDLFREITSNLSNEARNEIEAALDAVGADKKLFEDSIAAAVA